MPAMENKRMRLFSIDFKLSPSEKSRWVHDTALCALCLGLRHWGGGQIKGVSSHRGIKLVLRGLRRGPNEALYFCDLFNLNSFRPVFGASPRSIFVIKS